MEGGGVYADVDRSAAGTVRLTLYDSLPGRAVDAPPPQGVRSRLVRYEARIGPLASGAYDIIVGWFDPRTHLIEVRHEPLQVKVGAVRKDERRTEFAAIMPDVQLNYHLGPGGRRDRQACGVRGMHPGASRITDTIGSAH
jgi:hypothetical protein